MSEPFSEEYTLTLHHALLRRREAWKALELHLWFDVTSEANVIESRVQELRIRLRDSGSDGSQIEHEVSALMKDFILHIHEQLRTLQSALATDSEEGREFVLAQLLADTFSGSNATIAKVDETFIHLFNLAMGSKIHRDIITSFRGSAAQQVLSFMVEESVS